MKTTLSRRFLGLGLAVFIAIASLQSAIAAFVGEKLPDCHFAHDDECGYTSEGECGHICEFCDYWGAATAGVTAVAQSAGPNIIIIKHVEEDWLEDEIDGMEQVNYDASHIIIETNKNHMTTADWRALGDIVESMNNPISLTVNDLAVVAGPVMKDVSKLRTLSLPDTVEIGAQTFNYCTSLEYVSLPKVETIGERAFVGCTGLKTVELPEFAVIAASAFDGRKDIFEIPKPNPPEEEGSSSGTESNESESSQSESSQSESSQPESSQSESSQSKSSQSESSQSESSQSESSQSESSKPESSQPESGKTDSSSDKKPGLLFKKAEEPAQISASTAAPVTNEEVMEAITSAMASPKSKEGGAVTLRFVNKRYISLSQMKEIARVAGEAGKSAIIHADTMIDNVVINRLYIDPAKAKRGLRLMTGTGADTTLRKFEKYTANTLAVLSLAQQGGYGMKLGVAFKLKLPAGVKADNLVFYNYNPETNRYKRIDLRARDIGKNYLWLETDKSGFIVISENKLQKLRQKQVK